MDPLSITDIMEILPHRFPFILVDKVLRYEVEKDLVAIKNVTINEPFFTGHFPQEPVMPGVLIVEALAQASGILALKTNEARGVQTNEIHYFAAIEKVRFKRMVVPGDTLELTVNLLKSKQNIWKFSGLATVEGEVACTVDVITARGISQ